LNSLRKFRATCFNIPPLIGLGLYHAFDQELRELPALSLALEGHVFVRLNTWLSGRRVRTAGELSGGVKTPPGLRMGPGANLRTTVTIYRVLKAFWCPGLDSNQHGLAAWGFSYHFGFRRPLRVRGLEHAFTMVSRL